MNKFFENHIIIETNRQITIEEENEVIKEVKKIFEKKNKKVTLLTDFVNRVII